MERTRFSRSQPINDPILEVVDVGDDTTELVFVDPLEGHNLSVVRHDAERALNLLASSAKPAVWLVRDWQVLNRPHTFEHMELYREVAAEGNAFLVQYARAVAGGTEHLLFMSRTETLTEGQLLACLDVVSPRLPALSRSPKQP